MVWNKAIPVAFIVLIIVTLALSEKSSLYPQLKEKAEKLDPRFIPTVFKTNYGNERINVDVEMYTKGIMHMGIVTEDSVVKEFEPRYINNPTLHCTTTEDFLTALLSNQNVIETYELGLVNGQLYCEKIIKTR